jgi:GDPmannose 4,6-dehydratase
MGLYFVRPINRILYFRSTGDGTLLGYPTKAEQNLGWVPEITAKEMCNK